MPPRTLSHEILKSVAAKRSKLSYLMVHGLAADETGRVASILKDRKFSVLIDESTDVSVAQVLALVVRVYDPLNRKTQDLLLDLVEPHGGTAQGLFQAVMDALKAAGVDQNNIIGLGADNCSTMMGANGGLRALLEEVVPGLFVMGCVCHSLALCSGHAARCLPSWLEMLVKDIASYLSRSPKRRDALALIQEAVNAPCHQIPKVAMTRWLSRGAVLQRIFEQYEALKLFFRSEAVTTEGKENRAAEIAHRLEQQGTKHMLLFVHFVIKKVDVLNLLFQSEDYQLHRLYQKMAEGYRTLLSLYVLPETLSTVPLHSINPEAAAICKPLKDIDLGGRCEGHLLEEPLREGEVKLRSDAQAFLQQLCSQIKRRFDMDSNGTVAQLSVLDPVIALLPVEDRARPRSLVPLMVRFKHLVPEDKRDDLNDEWRELPVVLATAKIESKSPLTPPVFWAEVAGLSNAAGEARFPLLTSFTHDLMSLPHSTAAVERIFSQVNRVKTGQTNRLKVDTTKGRIMAKQAARSNGGAGCTQFEPSRAAVADAVAGGPYRRYRERESARDGITMETAEPNE